VPAKKGFKPGKESSLAVGYKIQIHIKTSDTLEVLFGSQLTQKSVEKESPLTVAVEILGTFKFKEKILNQKNKISLDSIKPLPNMLAILFPFIREKTNSLLFNNQIVFYLPPINTFALVEDLKDKIVIFDERKKRAGKKT